MRWSLLAALTAFATPAGALDIMVGPSIEFQSVRLWHDASGVDLLLGSPSSILDYPVLVAPSLSLRGETAIGGWNADAALTVGGFGTGTFRDTDYRAGGVLFSDSLSTAALHHLLSGHVSISPDVKLRLGERWTVSPLVRAGAMTQAVSSYGLACGAVCAAVPLPGTVEVIRHQIYGWRAGAGVTADYEIGRSSALTADMVVFAGALNIDDTHLLRPDLGAGPNIQYRNTIVGLDGDIRYRHGIGEDVEAYLRLGGGLELGWGSATFAAQTAAPLTFPSGLQRLHASFGAGLTGQF